MEADLTTYNDLHIFEREEDYSIFNKLNFSRTEEGRRWLHTYFQYPFSDARLIRETQDILRLIGSKMQEWPESISNGTLMVIGKFYETGIDTMPARPAYGNALSYKLFHSGDFSLVRYTLEHVADFLRGMQAIVRAFQADNIPPMIGRFLLRMKDLLDKPVAVELARRAPKQAFAVTDVIRIGRYIRHEYRSELYELMSIFGRLDAWYSMAVAVQRLGLQFPEFIDSGRPQLHASGLYHVLLDKPVPYDVEMDERSNFIFLTGANMAGKSTFIKAVGSAVFLAHVGMGVPAASMRLTVFDGLLSNINVADNLVKGESYFFNEVQRIKNTIVKINDGRKWLVLIDELFKGTNVQDAMKCSAAVIKGLIRMSNSLFVVSTHLYEISEELREYPNICFRYFETEVNDDQLSFSYQLKDGVSNDRIGYLILKRENVVEMLEKL